MSLIVVVGASVAVFAALVARATDRRRWVELGQWAAENGYEFRRGRRAQLPLLLQQVAGEKSQVVVTLENEALTVVEMMRERDGSASSWHALIRRVEGDWPAAALRPAQVSGSVIDWFGLARFERLGDEERFVVQAAEESAARALVQSPIRALLPADLGLLRRGDALLLDFSVRPFDPIELGRLIALSEQLGEVCGRPAADSRQ